MQSDEDSDQPEMKIFTSQDAKNWNSISWSAENHPENKPFILLSKDFDTYEDMHDCLSFVCYYLNGIFIVNSTHDSECYGINEAHMIREDLTEWKSLDSGMCGVHVFGNKFIKCVRENDESNLYSSTDLTTWRRESKISDKTFTDMLVRDGIIMCATHEDDHIDYSWYSYDMKCWNELQVGSLYMNVQNTGRLFYCSDRFYTQHGARSISFTPTSQQVYPLRSIYSHSVDVNPEEILGFGKWLKISSASSGVYLYVRVG